MEIIDKLIAFAQQAGASDLHLAAGCPPVCRLHGRLLPFDAPDWPKPAPPAALAGVLEADDLQRLARRMMSETQYRQYQAVGEGDFAYTVSGVCRCRVNVYKQLGNTGLALRLLKKAIPPLAELGLPEVVAALCRKPRGLLLVTGATGSGKSTTLAAMLDLINEESRRHIITLEDPVEYVHEPKQSLFSQREVGRDTRSYASALRAALREDPDVILVGEMRDPETIGIALSAAETGHLVLGALHTVGAAQATDRIISVFSPHQQQQIRIQLSNTLVGVTAQTLLPRKDQTGRIAVVEALVATFAVRNLIREGKTHQLVSQMQTGAKYGMQTLDMALLQVYQQGAVAKEVVLSQAADPETMLGML